MAQATASSQAATQKRVPYRMKVHHIECCNCSLWNDGSICTTAEMRIKQGKVAFEHPGHYSAYAVANWTNEA